VTVPDSMQRAPLIPAVLSQTVLRKFPQSLFVVQGTHTVVEGEEPSIAQTGFETGQSSDSKQAVRELT